MGWLGLLAIVALALLLWLQERVQARQLRALAQSCDDARAAHQSLLQVQAHMDDFVAAVGHELRTPMGAILGLNGVLRRELADRPQDVEVVDRIRQATGQLLQVADKMLEFSRLQAGKVQLYPKDFDLIAALDELMARCELQARRKGLVCQWLGVEAVPQRVHMDRQRLLQVLDELLDNAIRHTPGGRCCCGFGKRPGDCTARCRTRAVACRRNTRPCCSSPLNKRRCKRRCRLM